MKLDIVGETVDDPYTFVPDSSNTDTTMPRIHEEYHVYFCSVEPVTLHYVGYCFFLPLKMVSFCHSRWRQPGIGN